MKITNEIARFDLDDHAVVYGGLHNIAITNGNGQEIQSFPLQGNPLYITIKNNEDSGKDEVILGTGEKAAPYFTRIFQPRAEVKPFSISERHTGIGLGDLRDLRVAHHYDLEKTTIALESDGVYLHIYCPGIPLNGPVDWYKEVSGN